MDQAFSGFVLDPSKCHNLSIEKKRELVRELSKWPESAPEKLQAWSRRDLLEILCAEIGKERKYTGMTKQKMIENLFRIVSEKKSGDKVGDMDSTPDLKTTLTPPSKRQRKSDHPSRLPLVTNNLLASDDKESVNNIRYCQNAACRAALNLEDAFCKRCSCCICHKYDENKDPSLWLFCSSDNFSQGSPCGLSCHIECALKNEKAGIVKNGKCASLDGSYYCVYCGKVNDLLGCWKKQLMVAKDARRVDALCYRISLSHKLLGSTVKYRNLHEMVDTAMKKLEAEVGSINGFSNMARGIVNRLSVGAEVQRLCARAGEMLDTLRSGALLAVAQAPECSCVSSSFIKFEDKSNTSLTLVLSLEEGTTFSHEVAGFTLWHRKADTAEYPKEPTCTLFIPKRRALITELAPATEYIFRLVAFSNIKELGMWEVKDMTECIPMNDSMSLILETTTGKSSSLTNPSVGDESNHKSSVYADLNKSPESFVDCFEKPEILDLEKMPHAQRDESHQKSKCMDIASGAEVIEAEETPENSGSALDEELNSTIQTESHRDSTNSMENNQASDLPKSDNESNAPSGNEMVIVPPSHSDNTLPATPCRLETGKEGSGRGSKVKPGINLLEGGLKKPDREPGSSSKKRGKKLFEEICVKGGIMEGAYEYCIKAVRWLECEGHIGTNFRVKFLTWFSLRASPQERRIVNVYVDTLADDPASLAGQLVDTFSGAICSKRPPAM